MRHVNPNTNPHRNDRSRQHHRGDERRQYVYPVNGGPVERLSYPDTTAAASQSRRMDRKQQMQSSSHMNGIPQYSDEGIQYGNRVPQHGFDKVIDAEWENRRNSHIEYGRLQTLPNEEEQLDQRLQEEQDALRYAELYEEVFAPRSRTPSGLMTSTERTQGTRTQTLTSRSTSGYGSTTMSSSSESDSDEDNWEDNILSALNDMAGNLKKISGIQCSNEAGPDSTEFQLKINLPLPMHNLDTVAKDAMATLSPKKCNMQYDYSHLDDFDVEEQFLGAMDKLQGNMMPVYKSLFQSQSDSSSDDDNDDDDEIDQSESTYEDARFLPKVSPGLQQQQQQQQQHKRQIALNTALDKNVDGIPSLIVIADQPSGVSSSDSWMVLSPRDKRDEYPAEYATNNGIIKNNINLDGAIQGSGVRRPDSQWIPATKQRLVLEDQDSIEKEDRTYGDAKPIKVRPDTTDMKSHIQIPQMIDCAHSTLKNDQDIPGCYSDLTIDFHKSAGGQMPTQLNSDKDNSSSNTPVIKTHFSGDEIIGSDKSFFQRNSAKKGNAFNPGLNELAKNEPAISKIDLLPTEQSPNFQSYEKNKSISAPEVMFEEGNESTVKIQEPADEHFCSDRKPPGDEIDSRREEESKEERKQKIKKQDEERKQVEVEARAAEEAKEVEANRKIEEERRPLDVEVKVQLKSEAERKTEEERRQKEAEAVIKIEEEKMRLDVEAKAEQETLEVMKLEEINKRIEAEAKAEEEEMSLEAKKLEEERKRTEDEARASREALDAKELEEERKRMEAKAKAESEKEALEAKENLEEKTLLDAKVKEKEDSEIQKLEEEIKRKEAKAKAQAKEALETKRLAEERNRIEAERINGLNEEEQQTPSSDRSSLYKMRGFDDYCKKFSNASTNNEGNGKTARRKSPFSDIDMEDADTYTLEKQSTSNIESSYDEADILDYSSNSNRSHSLCSEKEEISVGTRSFEEQSASSDSIDAHSSWEESDMFSDATSFVTDYEDFEKDSVRELMTKNTCTRSVNFTLSSGETVNAMDNNKTVNSTARRGYSQDGVMKSQLLSSSSSYSSDMPIRIAATMSTLHTFDQGTVRSGQRSLGRYLPCDESVISSASYSQKSVVSIKPVATSVTALRGEKNKSNDELKIRSSILGNITSLVLRLMLSIVVFIFTWIKHLVTLIGRKQSPKIDCTPTRFALPPDQSIRREEIQDRSMDSFIHRANTRRHGRSPYLLHEEPHREHFTTTMVMKPAALSGYLADDSDEVGTCVESIVPDSHCPSVSDGKISSWRINAVETELSSLSSPPSTSFRALKKAYSVLSSKQTEREKSNWMDHDTIDDEMSYYD